MRPISYDILFESIGSILNHLGEGLYGYPMLFTWSKLRETNWTEVVKVIEKLVDILPRTGEWSRYLPEDVLFW